MVLPALREENLAKIEEENNKKFECSLAKSERERMFETVKRIVFKKSEMRLIEKQVRSIEPSRGSQNF